MRDPLRLAFGTLTAVRVVPPASLLPPVPGRAMALAPLTGLVPGVGAAVVGWLGLRLGLSTLVIAVLCVGMFALTTRGLHLDGLADTADGLAASYDRDRALAVMRRGDTGPTGLAAVVLVLFLQVAALSQVLATALAQQTAAAGAGQTGSDALGQAGAMAVVIAVTVAARLAIPLACVRGVPSARPDGLGATVAGSVGFGPLALSVLATTLTCALAGRISGFDWWTGPLVVLTVAVVTALLVGRAVQRFGGITGDVLGAAVEFATAVAVLTLAVTT